MFYCSKDKIDSFFIHRQMNPVRVRAVSHKVPINTSKTTTLSRIHPPPIRSPHTLPPALRPSALRAQAQTPTDLRIGACWETANGNINHTSISVSRASIVAQSINPFRNIWSTMMRSIATSPQAFKRPSHLSDRWRKPNIVPVLSASSNDFTDMFSLGGGPKTWETAERGDGDDGSDAEDASDAKDFDTALSKTNKSTKK